MFDPEYWCSGRTIPSPKHGGWCGLVISGGNVKGRLGLSFSPQLAKHCDVVQTPHRLYTVVWIREGLLNGWKRARGSCGLRRALARIFSERDGRTYFPEVWNAADATEQMKAKSANRPRPIRRDCGGGIGPVREVFRGSRSVRLAAGHYRDF